MKQIFVVYETDAWHSTSHRDCAGVFTSKWAAVNAIVKNHRIELDEFFSEEEIEKTPRECWKPRQGADSARNWSLPTKRKAMRPTMTSRSGISMNGILLIIERYDQQAEKNND